MTDNSNNPLDHDLTTSASGMESSAQFLDAIKQATRLVASSLNQHNVLFNILKSSFELIQGVKDARIFLLERDLITCCAEMDCNGNLQLTFPEANEYGWVHQFYNRQEMFTRQDAHNRFNFDDFPQAWTGSVLAEVFEIQEDARGVMVLALEKERSLSKNEQFILDLLKDQASIALHNAVLHREVEEQALTDTLTGLPNRRSLDYRLQEELVRALHYQHVFALLLLDIDEFKQVNDHHGHPAGDVLLIQVAQFLRGVVRKTDFIARYGGDEFAVILPETNEAAAEQIASRMNRELEKHPFILSPGIDIHLGASIGFAAFPGNGVSSQQLIESADRALYRKKSSL